MTGSGKEKKRKYKSFRDVGRLNLLTKVSFYNSRTSDWFGGGG